MGNKYAGVNFQGGDVRSFNAYRSLKLLEHAMKMVGSAGKDSRISKC